VCAKPGEARQLQGLIRRPKERYLLIPLWQETSASEFECGVTPADDELGNVQRVGMRLQHTLLQTSSWDDLDEALPSFANDIATLREQSRLDGLVGQTIASQAPPGQELARVAAAYHLWPFYSAIYYGYPTYDYRWEGVPATHAQKRVHARQMLCSAQKLLFANSRATHDFLRASFDVLTDSELLQYLSSDMRLKWRPERLVRFKPDLCSIDSLATDIINMQQAAALIREATMSAHCFAMDLRIKEADLTIPSRALRLLGVAQMTLFYNPHPHSVREVSLQLHEMLARNDSGDIERLRLMVPFHLQATGEAEDVPDPIAASFRRLADAIYSCEPKRKPMFLEHRNTTISLLKSGDHIHDFVSDGAITCLYLNVPPDPRFSRKPPYWFRSDWDSAFAEEFPDWIENDWWIDQLTTDEVLKFLFANGFTELHANHHMSSFWDHLAADGVFLRDTEEVRHWIENKTKSGGERHDDGPKHWTGFLMELLLRREESLTRTSFFLPLAQTHTEAHELDQFAGGTFIGLERPGIPYEEARFKEVSYRMMPLVLALADCCKTTILRKEEQDRKERDKRRNLIFTLIEGSPRGSSGVPEFGEGPPFRFRKWHSWTDRLELQRKVPLLTILEQWHRHFTLPISCDCWETLKALFYVFHGNCPDERDAFSWPDPADRADCNKLSYKDILCIDCLDAILRSLVEPPRNKLLPEVTVTTQGTQPVTSRLPSKPGIRFIAALSDLLNEAAKGEECPDWLECIELSDRKLTTTWTSDRFASGMETKIQSGDASGTSGYFFNIAKGKIPVPSELVCGEIMDVLRSPNYYTVVRYDFQGNKIIFRW
jgi:hypothetical protein